MKPRFLLLSSAWLLLFVCLPKPITQAQVRVDQLSDAQIQQFVQRAQASGLSEAQIEQAALSQGFTPADVARMRARIAGAQPGLRPVETRADSGVVRQQASVPAVSPFPVQPAPAAVVPLPSRIFGASFFQNPALSFEPNLRLATPRDYVLGPDDQLLVAIYGNASYNYRLTVSPEGTVRIENLAPILVSGLTIDEARARIVGRLRQAYAGLNRPGGGVSAEVTLGNVRSIRVTLTGEAVRPGTYTVSSLSTAFNALYQAGGPSANGSFRAIEVRRGNRVVRIIDLYDFLLRADQSDNVLLRDGDVIRIPDYLTRIDWRGEVRRPLLFELKPGETLRDALAFAGGFTEQAYTASLTLRRNTPRERRVENVTPEEIATLMPQRGDVFTVGKILDRVENQVSISGAVFRPGAYALEPGTATVRELVAKAEGVRPDAFLGRALLRRENNTLDAENLSLDLGKLLRGETPDIPLRRQDSLVVRATTELRESYTVSIQGAVNRGGTFAYADSLRVADLILLAGGFQEGATPNRVEVARRLRSDDTTANGRSVDVFRFDLDRSLALRPDLGGFALQPFDAVYVRNAPKYEAQRQVIISGEVQYPGAYSIREQEERIADLINRAGGLREEAFLQAARFLRRGELVAIDLRRVLDNPDLEANLLLRDGDSLVIPRKNELVRIQGAVLNPATVNYAARFSLSDYISQAGGFTDKAIRRKLFVTYANGTIDRTRKLLFFNQFPRPAAGMIISVPAPPERNDEARLSPAERVGMYSLFGSLVVAIATVLTRVF